MTKKIFRLNSYLLGTLCLAMLVGVPATSTFAQTTVSATASNKTHANTEAGSDSAPIISQIELVGTAEISGTATDQTGLTDVLADEIPHNQFGGISAIDWIPDSDRYFVLSDRGPRDGAVSYSCRAHEIELKIDPTAQVPVEAKILKSTLLTNYFGSPYVGVAHALSPSPTHAHRLDPEGVRVDKNGLAWVSDEYGPHLFCFNPEGRQVTEISVPENFRIEFPHADPLVEDQRNRRGRRSNRGMEGLALTPSGCLIGLIQSPLLQDGYADDEGSIVGFHSRLIRFDLQTGSVLQYVYRQEKDKHKMHEILAIDETRFLVLEQDGKFGSKSDCKRIFMIDIEGATDISGLSKLPGQQLPPEIVPVSKSLVLDLLDPKFGVGETMPEKVEGLSWGKPLPDGRSTLIVATDNDFRADQATKFYVFALRLEKTEP